MQSSPRVSEALLREALNRTGSPAKAAAEFKVNRRTVYRWMDAYGIKRQQSEFDKAA
jgi:transcriptional regulator with PAS, ATPase and Fis domain